MRNGDKPRPRTCGLYERACAIWNVLSALALSGQFKASSAGSSTDGESKAELGSGMSWGSSSASAVDEVVDEVVEEDAGCSALMKR